MMNQKPIQTFRLAARGRGGLACDREGIALGAADLARAYCDGSGRRRCEVVPPEALHRILSACYGAQAEEVVLRLHRGLRRAAAAIEASDLGLAGIETVLLGLPDLTPQAEAGLAKTADLFKWGAGWENQPRVPAGQPDGGQWTTDDDLGGAPDETIKPATHETPSATASGQEHAPTLDDGVYHLQTDEPRLTVAGAEEDEASRGSNGPPDDFATLEQIFPGLGTEPGLGIPIAPIDGFLGISAVAEEANLEAALAQNQLIINDIKRIDPSFVDEELLPTGGIAGLSWQGRTNLINDLLMKRAAAYYNILGDAGPLQVEALRFLQGAVDKAYDQAFSDADAGRLQPRLSREAAIGNEVDAEVRDDLRDYFFMYGIQYGPGEDVTINNRNYETSGSGSRYRIPDARLGDAAFDWTLSTKSISDPQIRGFFRADSQPRAVVIIRPSQLGGTYLIPRPSDDWLYP